MTDLSVSEDTSQEVRRLRKLVADLRKDIEHALSIARGETV